MKTEDLIARLAAQTRPVARGALLRRLLLSMAIGAAVATVLVLLLYGPRADLGIAVTGTPFWMKAIFSGSIAILAFFAIARAARPHARLNTLPALLAIPFVLVIAVAVNELNATAPSERLATWLGHTWRSCPFSIAGLSLAPLALLMLALRESAPAQPAVAGAIAGLVSGGIAATAYGLHCPEASASFVATWYALGILVSALLGAFAGRRLLQW
jgi:hypothetical protein